jgi:hypothetical protein
MPPHALGQLPEARVPVNACIHCFRNFGSAALLEAHRQLHTHNPTTIQNTDPEMTWKKAKKLMKKDERWLVCEVLGDIRKTLFQEHISSILDGQQREFFHEFLKSVPDLELKLSRAGIC